MPSQDLKGWNERSCSRVRSEVRWTWVDVEGRMKDVMVRLKSVIRERAIDRRGFSR